MNGAQWLVRRLIDGGVERVFVLCGNGLNPFLDACLDFELPIVDVRNEQAAAFMADLTGRATGSLGVAAVSSGPGHTNALTGLTNSHWDGGPMLLISGCSDLQTRGRDHFQELDQVGMARPVCKYSSLVTDNRVLASEVDNALSRAVASRPGPVHLTIPVNILEGPMPESPRIKRSIHVLPSGAAEQDQVRAAVARLARAKKPIVVAGSGAFYSGAWHALKQFAAATHIPVFSLLWDRGCVEESIPEYVGVVSTEVNAAAEKIVQADLILTLGARVDFRLTYGEPPMVSSDTSFIRVDADPNEIHRGAAADIGIAGSPRMVLEQLNEAAADLSWEHDSWLDEIRDHRKLSLDFWLSQPEESAVPITSLALCRELMGFLQDDLTFLLDGGNIGRWAHMLFYDRHPSHWFTCGISGVIGWGIPGAVAANYFRPHKPVLLLSGDGSAGFTLGDIQTAVRFQTPFTAVVAHDSAWGIVVDEQPEGRAVGSRLSEIRFDRVAEALGGRGVYIEKADQLAPAVKDGLSSNTVTFIHVPTKGWGIKAYRNRLSE